MATADNPANPVKTTSKGIALTGYDLVVYFTASKPTMGSEQFSLEFNGAKYLFADATNRDLFRAIPQKCEPPYRRYCVFAVSQGHAAGISTSD